jgi:hypothetical protein
VLCGFTKEDVIFYGLPAAHVSLNDLTMANGSLFESTE